MVSRVVVVLVAAVLSLRCASALAPASRDARSREPGDDVNPNAANNSTDPMRIIPRDRVVAMMRAEHAQCAAACFTSLESSLPEPVHQHELVDIERDFAACCDVR